MSGYAFEARDGACVDLHGEIGKPCADCADTGTFLCDYPVGGGHTCDRSICHRHSRVVGDDMHYCITHYRTWRQHQGVLPETIGYRRATVPMMVGAALEFMYRAFQRRDTGHRGDGVAPFLLNSAIPLGQDGMRAGAGTVEDSPFETLAGGIAWCLHHELAALRWRQPPYGVGPTRACYSLTRLGLALMEGDLVELNVRD